MFPRIAWILLVSAAAASAQVPPEVDQALRARVDEFFRYHVEGGPALRKAMEMVADDTKDDYFSSGKLQVLKYELTGIEYNQDYTRAKVTLEVSRNVAILGQLSEMTLPMPTLWKIEGGKWMWYLEPRSGKPTLLSDSPLQADAPTSSGGRSPLPADLSKPEVIAALADSILRGASVDKQSVTLRWGQASEDQIVFFNPYPAVELELGTVLDVPGLTVEADKVALKAKENGLVHFRYAPPADFDARKQAPPEPFFVNLRVTPFSQVFRITVNFTKP